MKTPTKFVIQLDGHAVRAKLYTRGASDTLHADYHLFNQRFRLVTDETSTARAKIVVERHVRTNALRLKNALPKAFLKEMVDAYLSFQFPDKSPQARYHLTNKTHLSVLNIFRAYAGDELDLSIVTGNEAVTLVQKYVNHLHSKKRSAVTIDNHRRVLVSFFGWAIGERRVQFETNPAIMSPRLKMPGDIHIKPVPPVSKSDVDKILEATKKKRYYPTVVLVLAAGLRPIGTTRLKWKDVNFDAKTLWVEYEKGVGRNIALGDWAVGELYAVFTRRRQPKDETRIVPYERNWITNRFTRVCKKLFGKKTHIRLKNLRNTFMNEMYLAGAQPSRVAALAGNSTKTIEKHYLTLRTLHSHETANIVNFRPTPKPVPKDPPPEAQTPQQSAG